MLKRSSTLPFAMLSAHASISLLVVEHLPEPRLADYLSGGSRHTFQKESCKLEEVVIGLNPALVTPVTTYLHPLPAGILVEVDEPCPTLAVVSEVE